MRKIVSICFTGSLVISILAGCSSKNLHPQDPSHSSSVIYTNMKNNSKLKNIIKKAAQEKGWRVTEFKENALIAEKFDDENPKYTTIKFQNGYIDFDNGEGTSEDDIVDLKEYIDDLTHTEESLH
jgi:hypothetical protein